MDSLSFRGMGFVFILMLVAATAGFFVGKTAILPTRDGGLITQEESSVLASPVFASQTATVQGTINKVDGSKISVTDDEGQEDKLQLSDKVVIYKFSPGTPQASASSDIKSIETEKKALLILELMDNKYQVVSVSYLPPTPQANQ